MKNNPSRSQKCLECPVENVTWNQVQDFIQKLNQLQTEIEFYLPSESQFEYASRAGTSSIFPFGDILFLTQANCQYPFAPLEENEYGTAQKSTIPVGSYQPNAFNVYDSSGNVAEFCADRYNFNYIGLPYDGTPNLTVGEQNYRVVRDSAWNSPCSFARPAARRKSPMNKGNFDGDFIGFRVAARRK